MKRKTGKAGRFAAVLLSLLMIAAMLAVPAAADEIVTGADINTVDAAVKADAAEPTVDTVLLETAETDLVTVSGTRDYEKAFEVQAIVNEERAAAGLQPLRMESSLLETAMLRAAECAIAFSHIRPDGTECFTANSKMSSENIHAGTQTAKEAMNAWMNSEGHKDNILTASFQTMGVGCFTTETGVTYWVQVFSWDAADTDCSKPANTSVKETIRMSPENTEIMLSVDFVPEMLYAGETGQFTIYSVPGGVGYFATPIGGLLWESSKPEIATIDNNGTVKAVAAGETQIRAYGENHGNVIVDGVLTIFGDDPSTDNPPTDDSSTDNPPTDDPASDVPPAGWPFKDVAVNDADWIYQGVSYVYDKEIMTGMTTTTFGPAGDLSRAQFATILYRMANKPPVTFRKIFPDVPAGEWYSGPVVWANDAKVITGYQTGLFGANDNITREQMAAMMFRYAEYCGLDVSQAAELSTYPDADKVSDWASEAMQWAVGTGIITGKDGGVRLDPQGNASRAECATIIRRFMEKYE